MMCTIQLEGKEQAIEPEDDHIIMNLVLLLDYENEDLRTNVKQALKNIADHPVGIIKITKYLASKVKFLEEVNLC